MNCAFVTGLEHNDCNDKTKPASIFYGLREGTRELSTVDIYPYAQYLFLVIRDGGHID